MRSVLRQDSKTSAKFARTIVLGFDVSRTHWHVRTIKLDRPTAHRRSAGTSTSESEGTTRNESEGASTDETEDAWLKRAHDFVRAVDFGVHEGGCVSSKYNRSRVHATYRVAEDDTLAIEYDRSIPLHTYLDPFKCGERVRAGVARHGTEVERHRVLPGRNTQSTTTDICENCACAG